MNPVAEKVREKLTPLIEGMGYEVLVVDNA